MNKIFDVIPIEDYAVVVAEDIHPKDIKSTDRVYCHSEGYMGKPASCCDSCRKIITTLYKRIDNIPLIELSEAERLSELAFINNIVRNKDFDLGFNTGYAAAQSKKYSEEDIHNLLLFTSSYVYVTQDEGKKVDFRLLSEAKEKWELTQRKTPKQVELSMEKLFYPKEGEPTTLEPGHGCIFSWRIKITHPETNTIIPLNVIYE